MYNIKLVFFFSKIFFFNVFFIFFRINMNNEILKNFCKKKTIDYTILELGENILIETLVK